MSDDTITEAEAEALRRWVVCDDRCQDPSMHDHFTVGGAFAWRWPRFHVYTPADRRSRAMLNRYPHNVIGAAVVVFGRCWGITWKGSPRRHR